MEYILWISNTRLDPATFSKSYWLTVVVGLRSLDNVLTLQSFEVSFSRT